MKAEKTGENGALYGVSLLNTSKILSLEYYEDVSDIITLIQEGEVDAIKNLPASYIREYIGVGV